MDFDAMAAQNHYKLRDEQEKYFAMMKGIMGVDRQRNWSELGKEGRLFILFVAQVIGCYMVYVRKAKLDGEFHSLQSVLDEMRPIRYIEHPNTKATITPFVGKQIEICEAFGSEIPEGCAQEYITRKTTKGMRGRPRKNPKTQIEKSFQIAMNGQIRRIIHYLANTMFGNVEVLHADNSCISVRQKNTFFSDYPPSKELSYSDILSILERNNKYRQACEFISHLTDEQTRQLSDELGEKSVILRFLPDFFQSGFLLRYPHGVVIKQFDPICYFRGENRIYESSKPSLYRMANGISSPSIKPLFKIRLQLFERVLNRLDVIQNWDSGTVLYDAIGQHYGLKTGLLDVSSSSLVALFFATTYYRDGQYHPITQDFIAKNPQYERGALYIYNRGIPAIAEGGQRFGENGMSLGKNGFHPILPIGFQPFMRCSAQYGYMIYGSEDYDLAQDKRFTKFTFLQRDEISLDIFKRCRGGQKIFPLDDSDLLSTITERINKLVTFSTTTVNESEIDEDTLDSLKKDGIMIGEVDDVSLVLSSEEQDKFNRQYRQFDFEHYYGIRTRTRMVR